MNKLNSLILAILTSSLVLPTVYAATFQQVSNQPTSILANNTLSSEQIRQLAQAVTVKVLSQKKGGSGVLISKQGKTYTILTNAHVTSKKGSHSIQTFDGKIHTATVINRGDSLTGNDLAVLQFESQDNYQIVSLASTSNLSENQEVFTAGFPDDSKELVITNGKISLLSEQPLIGGYQIGYTNKIRPGMSGGALLNQEGKLIGVNGLLNNAILNEAYFYQDGTQPNAEQLQQLKKFSFAVPIETLAKISPNLAIIPPEWRNQQQAQKPSVGNTFVDQVNNIAQQITVRIDSKNSGNGSGVIIAKQGQTYYVATARHVLQNPDNYEIITPDGKQYAVQPENIVKPEGLDAAIVKFTSNETYSVATISKYIHSIGDVISKYNGSSFKGIEKSWVFISGFPQADRGKRKLAPGYLSFGEKLVFNAESNPLFEAFMEGGYRLLYSNLSLPGMSGGPVLDVRGEVIGINAGIQNTKIRQTEIGFAYGVPSSSILSLATQAGVKKESLKVVSNKPLSRKDSEITLLENHPLFGIKKPSANASEKDWFEYANQMWRIEKMSETISVLQEVIKRKPDFYQAYYVLGAALRYEGNDPKKALAALDKATMLKPDYYEAWVETSLLLSDYKQYSLALAAIDKAIEYNDNDGSLYFFRSSIFFNLQRYPEALAAIDKAIEIQPYYFSYLMRCSIRFTSQDYQGALADINQVIKLQPDFTVAYAFRGIIRFQLKDTQGAIADTNQAIQIEPNNSLFYLVRGGIYEELKDNEKALADYTKAIAVNPEYAQAYNQRGDFYYKHKKWDLALADYGQGIKFEPDNANVYFARGNVYIQLKNYQAVLADYNQGIKLQPDYANAYFVRGAVYAELKNYQLALVDYNQVIKLQPDNANVYFERGVIYQKQGNNNAALSDYNQALAKDAKLAPAIINIGYIKYEKGDVEGAIQQWQKAVEINGKLAEPQMALAVALYAKGEQQKALNMAQAALGLDKSFADVEVLQQNLWGTRLVDEARKLLTTPSIQAFIKQ
ncbi:hypothetical protein A6S26_14225 [Nostoc sp. ATCC 43529]|nr:hypothetical protein A6S26_14225 [Nostoc sp. ATCC 43529]